MSIAAPHIRPYIEYAHLIRIHLADLGSLWTPWLHLDNEVSLLSKMINSRSGIMTPAYLNSVYTALLKL